MKAVLYLGIRHSLFFFLFKKTSFLLHFAAGKAIFAYN